MLWRPIPVVVSPFDLKPYQCLLLLALVRKPFVCDGAVLQYVFHVIAYHYCVIDIEGGYIDPWRTPYRGRLVRLLVVEVSR